MEREYKAKQAQLQTIQPLRFSNIQSKQDKLFIKVTFIKPFGMSNYSQMLIHLDK